MRLYAPMYEGDSFLRPDAAIGASVPKLLKTPTSTPDFVRSNIPPEAANESALDITTIVHVAHALRSAAMADLSRKAVASAANGLKLAYAAVADWLERGEYQARDDFFAASANLADLEQRQRHFERTGRAHY